VYLSPAVRTARDDPTDGVTTRLTIRPTDDAEPVRAVVAEHGTVEAVTRFGSVRATVPEPAVESLLDSLPEVEAVETWTAVADDDGAEG